MELKKRMPKTKYKIGHKVEFEIQTNNKTIRETGTIEGITIHYIKAPLYDIRTRNGLYWEQIDERFIKRAIFGGDE